MMSICGLLRLRPSRLLCRGHPCASFRPYLPTLRGGLWQYCMIRQQGTNLLKYVDLCVDGAHDSVKFHAGDRRLGQSGKPCARASSLCFFWSTRCIGRSLLVSNDSIDTKFHS